METWAHKRWKNYSNPLLTVSKGIKTIEKILQYKLMYQVYKYSYCRLTPFRVLYSNAVYNIGLLLILLHLSSSLVQQVGMKLILSTFMYC